MSGTHWKVEWRGPDPERPGEYVLKTYDHTDHDRMVEHMAVLLANPDNDCIHMKQYPAHEELDYGVDLTMVRRAVREVAGESAADRVVAKLRELGRR